MMHRLFAADTGVTGPSGVAYKDDLYEAVNGQWEKKAVIPADRAGIGGFNDLSIAVEKQLIADLNNMGELESASDKPQLQQAVRLFQLALDFDRRNNEGFKPALSDYQRVSALTDFGEINDAAGALYEHFPLPFVLSVEPDMKDTAHNAVYAYGPSLILPDTTYYADGNPNRDALLKTWREMAIQLLMAAGEKRADAVLTADQALAFDKSLVPYVKSGEEWSDYPAMYNPESDADFTAHSQSLDLSKFLADLLPEKPDTVIVTEPRYFENLNKIVNPNTFTAMHSWMTINYLISVASYLSDDLRQLGDTFHRAISGSQESPNQAKSAYYLTNHYFAEVIGQYYGQKYFGDEARQDVQTMIQKMIAVYEERLNTNTWLSPATRQSAVKKLEKIVVKVGYPDKLRPVYSKLKVDRQASLFANARAFNIIFARDMFSKQVKPVDRTEWGMPGSLVNAQYDPSRNDITFPAAILQAPFYSLKQSTSQNFGGIGAVIAHEISHAFDNNGAKFDEYGNLKNWWTKEDFAQFNKRTDAMVAEFDGLPYAGGKVNGKLILGENVADLGGMSAALAAAKKESDYDAQAFFINWARVWRGKYTQANMTARLATDPHAPNVLRANMQPRNFQEFYDAFHVEPGDGMYMDSEKRVHIW
ncbi:M13 family metallopeptidase [Schleiferilactobacillus perolens]|uniref:Neutral endopeptidase n=1 Tax=Schleiferilactobacillus perolens DSM 12744 TaxID=1423792 RepID=A0A0R1MWC2_9LACO|nr:M13 family metallopeptidase [Schleiferilactobacillus perolens]KRL12542.1 neutral endopeptidase [Schleiferilactobacillus perolens DSM 12744]